MLSVAPNQDPVAEASKLHRHLDVSRGFKMGQGKLLLTTLSLIRTKRDKWTLLLKGLAALPIDLANELEKQNSLSEGFGGAV